MTSVLNVGVMPSNPVGNQIRALRNELDAVRKEHAMLLSAFETRAPDVFAEFTRLKEEAAERVAAEQRMAQGGGSRLPPQIQARGGGRF